MAYSLVIKSPGATTDTSLPKLMPDLLLNAGSLFLFDFLRLGSWNPSTDVVADGETVRNMVAGAPNATLKIPAAGDLVFVAGKGFQLKSTLGLGRVQIGAGTSYFQNDLTHDFVITMWATYPSVDPTGHIGLLLSKSVSANYFSDGPMFAHRYINGGDGTAHMDAAASNGTTFSNKGSPAGLHQFAIAKVGANTIIYKDGVQIHSAARGTPDLAANAIPLNFGSGGAANQYACPGVILHRIYAEDLTVSGLTAAGIVSADYGLNAGRF